ncbi:MAG: extracellular solute-binding protein, partial [Cellulomonas sp.]|nr:extracellular solute-binding protein [Cellulomonas sp.]
MKRSIPAVAALAAVASLALAACSGGTSGGTPTSQASGGTDTGVATAPAAPVELTVSGWSLATTPEFKVLADAFHAKHSNVTVTLKEYDASKYNDLITADLAANAAPDIITQKNVSYVTVFAPKLVDVSDLVAGLPQGINGVKSYEVDGKQYALPYRNDSWVLFYNKDLFDKAGVAIPDGSWTWDDYAAAAKQLTTKLKGAGSQALGTYQHSWQSVIQGFANSQTPGANILSGKYDYMKPYYQRALDLQSAGAQVDAGTITTSKLTYQAEFGKQQAAMMPMGSWFVATLIAQQKSGDADKFAWGFAPIPQLDKSTTGTSATPLTFGDPTGFGINKAIDAKKMQAAKDFLAFAASEDAAKALAQIGITPALTSDTVATTYFATAGAPTDALSKFAWTTHKTAPENPTDKNTAAVQKILGDAHTAIMSGSSSIDTALAQATKRVHDEVGL